MLLEKQKYESFSAFALTWVNRGLDTVFIFGGQRDTNDNIHDFFYRKFWDKLSTNYISQRFFSFKI